ncbi:family 20 glycosylhydrolase [Streptomyces nogalater]
MELIPAPRAVEEPTGPGCRSARTPPCGPPRAPNAPSAGCAPPSARPWACRCAPARRTPPTAYGCSWTTPCPRGVPAGRGAGDGVEIRGGGPACSGAPRPCASCSAPTPSAAPPAPGRGPLRASRGRRGRPRFRWRGLLLDVARHFMPKEGVLRYLDLMAAHKLNVLHLHLTDDQGWRIEIRRYPKLTEIASWRSRTKFGHRASPLWDDKPHGGYYTQDDIREIVAYAAERHISVVPEIDVPGHSQAAIAAYPELGNTDVIDTTALSVWDTWGISSNVLAPTDTTLRFYEGVFEEVLELFPADAAEFSAFVHVGGDECRKEQWTESVTAKTRIADLGLTDEDALQSWFIGHFDAWLAARGRRLIGWDEILEGGLAPGAAVASWRGYAGGIAAARAPRRRHVPGAVRLPGPPAGPGDDEPVPIGFVRTLEDVYRFEPVPAGLTEQEARHVLGTQANVWSEVLEDSARVDYQAFPASPRSPRSPGARCPPPPTGTTRTSNAG